MYLAAIERNLNPRLFRVDADFFVTKLQATAYDKLIAAATRLAHIPVEAMVFTWHLLTIFAFLAACYRIASCCFEREYARWCGVALVTVLFTLPVTGTGLYIMDQNLVPRAIATTLALFAIDFVLRKRYVPAFLCLIVALPFHLVIAAFGLSLCFFLAVPSRLEVLRFPLLGAFALPFDMLLHPTSISPALQCAIHMHHYCDLWHWTWYEWLGVVGPILILFWFARTAERCAQTSERIALQRLATRTAVYGLFQSAVALLIMLPPALERMRPLEPMRYLHLLYVLTILLGGCFLGEYVLRRNVWRWAALFVPAALGMFLAQRALFPAAPHLELPGIHSSNPWVKSFQWIRNNTPEDAYFALGPEYLHSPDEDSQGFRALALRSALADSFKDSGMVLTSPTLAERWQREVTAQNVGHEDWRHVSPDDLRRLKAQFGVNWAIVERPVSPALDCPYKNDRIEVCRID